jgi:hypothetical protein
MRRSPKQSEFKAFERTGKLSYVQLIQAKVDAVLDRDLTFSQFVKLLENEAVRLTPVVSNSHEVIGTIYETEGFRVKGSRLGRGYTFEGLQKEWRGQKERKGKVLYEFAKDKQAICKGAILLEEGGPRATERKERYFHGASDKSHNGNAKYSDRPAHENRKHDDDIRMAEQTPGASSCQRSVVAGEYPIQSREKRRVASGCDASAEEPARGISDTGTMKIDVPSGGNLFPKDIESFRLAPLLQSSESLPHLITQQRHSDSRLNSLEDLQEQVGHKSSLTPALNTPQLLPVENIFAQEIQQDKPVLICARSEETEVARTSARVDVEHGDDFEIDDLGR